VANPQVTWTSRNTSVAAVLLDSGFVADSLAKVQVLGTGVGSAWIVASSGTLKDSVLIQVINTPPSNPVASIDLTPASMTLAKGDSNYFSATLRDSAGTILTTPQITWYLTDSSGVATIIWASGDTAWVHGNISGSTHIRAASQSKFKEAPITVP
jgi:Bacterial Ig-like domain (group 2)